MSSPSRPAAHPGVPHGGPARSALGLLVPALMWLGGVLVARAWGFEFSIPWSHFQILDRPLLERHPLGSLLLLHQQPPVFNGLLALCLRAASWLGTSPERVLHGLYLVAGLCQVWLFSDLVRRVCRSRALGWVGAAALLLDPAFHFYGNLGWYPFLVRTEVVLVAWAAVRTLESGRLAHLALTLGALLALTSTRTLFHPLFSVGAAALVAFLAWRRHPALGARRLALPLGAFLVLLALWPLKNALVFGQFTYSSITGINLVRITDAGQGEWLEYFNHGRVPPEVEARVARFQERYGDELAALVGAPEKFDGSRNWNHLVALHVGPLLAERANAWRRENPGAWARIVAMQYFMWARPAFTQSYLGVPRGPDRPAYRAYARAYERALFSDVRPLVEALTGEREFHKQAYLRRDGRPLVYTLFGLLWFPLVAGAALLGLWSRERRGTVALGAVLLALYSVGWTLAVPILTDGIESNRMRFSTSALFALLLLERVAALLRFLRARYGAD